MKLKDYIPQIIATIVLISGIINIVSVFLAQSDRLILLRKLLPLEIITTSRTLTILAGFFLIFLFRGLWQRKERAWLLSLLLIELSLVLHVAKGFDIEATMALLIPFALLVWYRHLFSVKSGKVQIQTGVLRAVLILLLLLGYAVLGFYALQGNFNTPVTFANIVKSYAYGIFGLGKNVLVPLTAIGRWFEGSLSIISAITLLSVFAVLFSPVVLRKKPSDEDIEQVKRLVSQYSFDPLSYMSYFEDKMFFFSKSKNCVIAYKTSGDVAVALGGPIGKSSERRACALDFYKTMKKKGYAAVFYSILNRDKGLFKSLGLDLLKTGEEATINTAKFTLDGSEMKDIRNCVTRAKREGLTYHWYTMDQIPWSIASDIDDLYTDWLESKKSLGLTFSMAFYPLPTNHDAQLLTAHSRDGSLQAAFTFFPYAKNKCVSLDLMMRKKDALNCITEAAIAESISYFKQQGVHEISLGTAPLADVHPKESAKLLGILKSFAFNNLNQFYNYQSLFTFKKKFLPDWSHKYLAHPKGILLPEIALAIINVQIKESLWKYILRNLIKLKNRQV